jgi:hypothetical protein
MAKYLYNGYNWYKVYGRNGKVYRSKEKKLLTKFKVKGIVFSIACIMSMYLNAYIVKITDYKPILNISYLLIIFLLIYAMRNWLNWIAVRERLDNKYGNHDKYEYINRDPEWYL